MELLKKLLIAFAIIIGGFILLAVFMYVFIIGIIYMIEDQSLFCISQEIFEKVKDSRFVGKVFITFFAFLTFLIEILSTITGYFLIIGIVLFKLTFDKEYGLNDCKERLFKFFI